MNQEHEVVVPDTNDKDRFRQVEPERMDSAEAPRTTDQVKSFYALPALLGLLWLGEGERTPQQRDAAEVALNEAFDQLNPATRSPRKRQVANMVTLGRATGLIVPTSVHFADFPFKAENETEAEWNRRWRAWQRKSPLPVFWRDLPAQSTFPASLGSIEDEVLSQLVMTWKELADIFSPAELRGVMPEPEKRNEQTTLVIHSNRRWLTYGVLEGEVSTHVLGPQQFTGHAKLDKVLRQIEHGMGRCAIRIWPGIPGDEDRPGQCWQGVLHHVTEIIPQIDRRMSESATASKFDTNPAMKGWFHDADESQSDARLIKEGDIIPLDPGDEQREKEDILPLHQPKFGEKGLSLGLEWLTRSGRITGAAEALEGTFGPSGQPAWSRQSSIDAAHSKFRNLTDGIVAMDIDVGDSILRAVAAHGMDVPLVRRKDNAVVKIEHKTALDYITRLEGDFNLSIPSNEIAMLQIGVGLMKDVLEGDLPGPSPEFFLAKMGVKQPFNEMQKTMEMRLLLSPGVRQVLEENFAQDLRIELSNSRSMSLAEVMAIQQELPPGFVQMLQGENGGNPRQGGPAQGGLRAQAPGSAQPGGPQPDGSVPLV